MEVKNLRNTCTHGDKEEEHFKIIPETIQITLEN